MCRIIYQSFPYAIFAALFLCCTDLSEKNREISGKNYDEKTNTGIVNTFYPNGKVSTMVKWVNGKKHGLSRSYYENGKLKSSVNYRHGIKQGVAKQYYEEGSVYRITNYLDNEIDGVRIKYWRNGQVKAEIPYKYGWPGNGLKEFTVSGTLLTDYPEVKYEKLYDGNTGKLTYVKIYTKGEKIQTKFYLGELFNGQFTHRRMVELPVENGEGYLDLEFFSDKIDSQKVTIISEITSRYKNPYITQLQIDL